MTTTETANTAAETTTTEASQPKTISDPNISFTDYQTLRRGGTLPATDETVHASAPAHKTESEHKETSKPGTEETEEKESESEESDESHEDESAAKDESNKPKKKGGFQRRIDKLNAAKAAAQQEAEYWKQQALKSAGVTNQAQVEPVTKTTDGKPNPDSFDTHAEWVEAVADWKAEQKFKERDQKLEQAKLQESHSKTVQTYAERLKAFSEKTADCEEVLESVDDVPLSQTVRDIILSSENGPELAYALAKDREEFARVCKLPPPAAYFEMGKIAAKIASKVSSENKTEPKKTTQAPKPIEPLGGGKSSAAKKSLEEMSFPEFVRHRREESKRKGA